MKTNFILLLLIFCKRINSFFDFGYGDGFGFHGGAPLPKDSPYALYSVFDKGGYDFVEDVSTDLLPYKNKTTNLYGIMIDAGSTGTRIQSFHFQWRPRKPYIHLIDCCFRKITPGLSYFASNPEGSVKGIEELISSVSECVPAKHWWASPIELKATAGLRLLPRKNTDDIMRNVEQFLGSTPFSLSKENNAVSVMDGVDEGTYAWFTVNYLQGRFHDEEDDSSNDFVLVKNPRKQLNTGIATQSTREATFGIVDLGGGSTQVTFAPMNEKTVYNAPSRFIHNVTVFGERFQLYSWSYLGLGLQSARLQLLGRSEDPDEIMQPNNRLLRSNCIHPDVKSEWRHSDSDYIVTGPEDASDFSFQRCYEECREFTASNTRMEDEFVNETFYGLSYLYIKARDSGLIAYDADEGSVSVCDFLQAAKQFCNAPATCPGVTAQPNEAVKKCHQVAPFMCLDLTYISAMFLEGFGFQCDQKIQVVTRLSEIEVSWSLGAVFHTLNSFHNTSQVTWNRAL